jgi:hypothetical protein
MELGIEEYCILLLLIIQRQYKLLFRITLPEKILSEGTEKFSADKV